MKTLLLLTAMHLAAFSSAYASQASCANDIAGLRALVGDSGLPTSWIETSRTRDNDPLALRISEGGGQLYIDLRKTVSGRSLGSGNGSICTDGSSFRARMPGRPSVRMRFTGPGTLEVSVLTWSGTFAPR